MSLVTVDAQENIPSSQEDLLRSTLGLKVKSVRRYEVNDDYLDLQADDLFTNAEGPLLIEFGNGLILGFGHQPSLNSVTVWLEQDAGGQRRKEGILEDPDFTSFSIDSSAASNMDASKILGQGVTSWEVQRSEQYSGLPNEQALVLTLTNGEHLVIAHGLPSGSDDLKVFSHDLPSERLSRSVTIEEQSRPDSQTQGNDQPGLLSRSEMLKRKGVWWVESGDDERVQKKDRHRYEYQHGTDLYTIYTEPDFDTLPLYVETLKKEGQAGPLSQQEAEQVLARVIAMLQFSGDPFQIIH